MDAATMKRMILQSSEMTGIRKRLVTDADNGRNHDLTIEMGQAFEQMTQTKGWIFVEEYIVGRSNPVALIMSGEENPVEKGISKGMMMVMQFVDQTIRAKNEILERINHERQKVGDTEQKSGIAGEEESILGSRR